VFSNACVHKSKDFLVSSFFFCQFLIYLVTLTCFSTSFPPLQSNKNSFSTMCKDEKMKMLVFPSSCLCIFSICISKSKLNQYHPSQLEAWTKKKAVYAIIKWLIQTGNRANTLHQTHIPFMCTEIGIMQHFCSKTALKVIKLSLNWLDSSYRN